MDDEAAVARAVGVLAAVGEPTRLRLVALLAGEELCVGDVQARLGLPQPLASLRAVLPPIPRAEGAPG
jgi:DNA-binding transcriptional ArsR family regulator